MDDKDKRIKELTKADWDLQLKYDKLSRLAGWGWFFVVILGASILQMYN